MKKRVPPELDFNERLAALRKERGLTQLALAELVEMHISQIRRYESGQSQPTLDTGTAWGHGHGLSRVQAYGEDVLKYLKTRRKEEGEQ